MRFLDHTQTSPHSVGLLWTSDRPVAETPILQHTKVKGDRHPYFFGIRNRNLSMRAAVDPRLRPLGHWDRRSSLYLLAISIALPWLLTFLERLQFPRASQSISLHKSATPRSLCEHPLSRLKNDHFCS